MKTENEQIKIVEADGKEILLVHLGLTFIAIGNTWRHLFFFLLWTVHISRVFCIRPSSVNADATGRMV